MALKTIPLLVSSASHILPLLRSPSSTASLSRWPASQLPEDGRVRHGGQRRFYAAANDSSSASNSRSTSSDATHWPSHANPTPYDILGHDRSAPYSKARFYKLVKLYHPDRYHDTSHSSLSSPTSLAAPSPSRSPQGPRDGLSHTTRLERYRLVILANDILSDPAKRRAYDTYGIGWTTAIPRDVNDLYRAADRSWRHRPGNAAGNATWEDWERWYQERDGTGGQRTHQRPVFMSNVQFVAMILATIAVGSAMQASRASESASHVIDQRSAHEQAIGESMRQQQQSMAGRGKGERIEMFVRERENWSYGFSPEKYEPQRHKSGK